LEPTNLRFREKVSELSKIDRIISS